MRDERLIYGGRTGRQWDNDICQECKLLLKAQSSLVANWARHGVTYNVTWYIYVRSKLAHGTKKRKNE